MRHYDETLLWISLVCLSYPLYQYLCLGAKWIDIRFEVRERIAKRLIRFGLDMLPGEYRTESLLRSLLNTSKD